MAKLTKRQKQVTLLKSMIFADYNTKYIAKLLGWTKDYSLFCFVFVIFVLIIERTLSWIILVASVFVFQIYIKGSYLKILCKIVSTPHHSV